MQSAYIPHAAMAIIYKALRLILRNSDDCRGKGKDEKNMVQSFGRSREINVVTWAITQFAWKWGAPLWLICNLYLLSLVAVVLPLANQRGKSTLAALWHRQTNKHTTRPPKWASFVKCRITISMCVFPPGSTNSSLLIVMCNVQTSSS